ncbi:MAG: hypothetical protein JFT10_06975 [Muribaculaceae bacterium]|nr:hypothetical protein [Muribaculaceae bacterium]
MILRRPRTPGGRILETIVHTCGNGTGAHSPGFRAEGCGEARITRQPVACHVPPAKDIGCNELL